MKSFPWVISFALVLAAAPVLLALPPIDKEWKERYANKDAPPAFREDAQTQKCNVCHEGNNKKNRNEYGKAVGKHLTKGGVEALKDNLRGQQEYIQRGLEKADAEQNEKGEKFADIMKKGKLPGSK